jgi:hypothetical protein
MGNCQVRLSTRHVMCTLLISVSNLLQDLRAMPDGPTDTATAAKPSLRSFGTKSAITEDAFEAACAEEELLDFSSESLLLAATVGAALPSVARNPTVTLPSCYCLPAVCITLGSSIYTTPGYLVITSSHRRHDKRNTCVTTSRTLSTPCTAIAGSRPAPSAHITQRMSLDLALASTSMQRMALRFEDVKICRRPDGSLWKLGSGGFGTVSASYCPNRVCCCCGRSSLQASLHFPACRFRLCMTLCCCRSGVQGAEE